MTNISIATGTPGSAEPPPPREITPSAAQLGWCMQRMAMMQRRTFDRLAIHDALINLDPNQDWVTQVKSVCERCNWPEPRELKMLDQANLPALIQNAEHGWSVVVIKSANGAWVLETPTGQKNILPDSEVVDIQPCLLLNLPEAAPATRAAKDMILKNFWQYKGIYIEGMLATILINTVALTTSFFSMQVYDRVIPSQGLATLLILALGVGLAIVFEFILKLVRSRVMEHAVIGLDGKLSRDIFERLMHVRLDQLPSSVGSLAGQLRAYEGIRALMTASTAYVLVDLPFALVFIAVIGIVGSPYLLLVVLAFFIFSVFTGLIIKKKIEDSAAQGARLGNMKTGLLVEAVEGAETIKAGYGGWHFLTRWLGVNGKSIHYDLRIRSLSEIATFLTATYQQLAYAGLVAVGAWQVIEGHMTIGSLIACSILSGRALMPVGMIPNLLVQLAHAKAALLGLESVYALQSDNTGIDTPLLPGQLLGNYRFEAVKYAYRIEGGSQFALSVPKFSIRAGQKVGVLGPVGSGKSTLLKLLSGMYLPNEGRILLDDMELSHISRQRVSEQVGYLQQDHRLFQGTLRENLLVGLPDPGDQILQEVCNRSGLTKIIANHPKGLNLPIVEGGKGLSGGQKQMVALTRLLLTQPRVWLLDEPTASMDEELERHCIAVLHSQFKKESTVVLVTHKVALLGLVDYLVVMSQQRILIEGPRDEVLQKIQQSAQQQRQAQQNAPQQP